METQNLTNLFVVAVAATLMFSCHKHHPDDPGAPPTPPTNPPEEKVDGKPFDVTLTEVRQSKTFTWEVGADGALDNHEESIKDLYVTGYTTVTVNATEEVNVAAADPGIVSVTRNDKKSYSLVFQADGATVITVWNGEGTGRIEKRFQVKGQEFVDVEGLRFTYGGEELIVKHVYSYRPALYCQFPQDEDNENYDKPRPTQNDFLIYPYWKPDIWRWDDDREITGTFVTNPQQGTMLVFEELYPENTSFRTVSSFESEWECFPNYQESLIAQGIMDDEGLIPEGKYHWPNDASVYKDYSEYSGTKQWVACMNTPMYMACVSVKTAKKTKFLCLTHGKEWWTEE